MPRASLYEVDVLSVRAFRAARAHFRGVYRYLDSNVIGSRVGLRAAPGRVLGRNFYLFFVALVRP